MLRCAQLLSVVAILVGLASLAACCPNYDKTVTIGGAWPRRWPECEVNLQTVTDECCLCPLATGHDYLLGCDATAVPNGHQLVCHYFCDHAEQF